MSKSMSSYLPVCAPVILVGFALFQVSCISVSVPIAGRGGPNEVTTNNESERPKLDGSAGFDALTQQGVTIAVIQRLLKFEAPVKGPAPLVVNFELGRKGTLQLDIWIEGEEDPVRFEFEGKKKEKMLTKEELPDSLGDWKPAQFSLRALDKSGKEIDYTLYAIGVGDRAVGSTGIWQVAFWPPKIRNAEPARWSFKSRHDFEKAAIAIYRWQKDVRGWQERQAFDSPCQPKRNEGCQGTWNGNDRTGARSDGKHLMAIKAWQSQHEHDWIFAISEEEVEVR